MASPSGLASVSSQNAKEAFRQISWRFHGKYPSLNKQEKKLKKIELGEAWLLCTPNCCREPLSFAGTNVLRRVSFLCLCAERRLQENPLEALPTLKALQRVQQGEGTAHLVLTGGSLDK